MTELDKLMKRLEQLDAELIANRDFLAKMPSSCIDDKTKEDVTACINSKLDLINWIRDLVKVIQADSQLSKERESNMGIWDKAIVSAGICAEHMTNVLNMTGKLQFVPALAARRTEALVLIDACNKFRDAMAKIDEEYTTEEKKEND